jgi:hypothetical protein
MKKLVLFVIAIFAVLSACPVHALLGRVSQSGQALPKITDPTLYPWAGGGGVVIAPHWGISASHLGGWGLILMEGTPGSPIYVSYSPTAVYYHPTADFLLMNFSNTFSSYISPYYGDLAQGPNGQLVRMAAYSWTSLLRTDYTGYDDYTPSDTNDPYYAGMRSATNRVGTIGLVQYNIDHPTSNRSVTTDSLIFGLDYDNSATPGGYNPWYRYFPYDDGPTSEEGGLRGGDSGSATFIQSDGQWRLVGINLWIGYNENYIDSNNQNGMYPYDSPSNAAYPTGTGDFGTIWGCAYLHDYGNWIDSVTANASGGNAVSGTITLQDYVGTVSGITGIVELKDSAGVVQETHNITLDESGAYIFFTTLSGNYTAVAKCWHWLAKAVPVSISGTQSSADFSLLNGDVNGDNFVEDQDYSLMGAAWYSSLGDANYNASADLNGDGFVEDQDYSIMGTNWYQSGDPL